MLKNPDNIVKYENQTYLFKACLSLTYQGD